MDQVYATGCSCVTGGAAETSLSVLASFPFFFFSAFGVNSEVRGRSGREGWGVVAPTGHFGKRPGTFSPSPLKCRCQYHLSLPPPREFAVCVLSEAHVCLPIVDRV